MKTLVDKLGGPDIVVPGDSGLNSPNVITRKGKKRALLGATWSVIENLGLIHLLGLLRDEGWESKVVLPKNHDFTRFHEEIADFKPDVVGYNIYSGCEGPLYRAFDKVRRDHPNIRTIIGGPHATYFPDDAVQHADYAVVSEGFDSFKRILNDEVYPGILTLRKIMDFPHPDRETFYRDSPEHRKSPIKSMITMTSCPYDCYYCYNSTPLDWIKSSEKLQAREKNGQIDDFDKRLKEFQRDMKIEEGKNRNNGGGKSVIEIMKRAKGRAFVKNVRTPEAVLKEGRELAEAYGGETKMVYMQDDIYLMSIGSKTQEMVEGWRRDVGLPIHAQMRWEMTEGEKGDRRLDLAKRMGASGLTLAIEAGSYYMREDIGRKMPERLMFEGMKKLKDRDLKVRTEQITGLIYGGARRRTRMNLRADLELLELNVRLLEETGGPDVAWASTLVLYPKTKVTELAITRGHSDGYVEVNEEFFERSRGIKHLKDYHGLKLLERKDDPSIWLNEEEQNRYADQNAELRNHFNTLAMIPKGHLLAEKYLQDTPQYNYSRLGGMINDHINWHVRMGNPRALEIQKAVGSIRELVASKRELNGQIGGDLLGLAPYFAVLPKPELVVNRTIRYVEKYAGKYGDGKSIHPYIFSAGVRRHLYDNVLYMVGDEEEKITDKERYPAKV